ncbi:MAG: DAK2 domain-containing protein [Clostridia bacterium]|nr:DAK2 domain-containing protein [Clostridia bacterium]
MITGEQFKDMILVAASLLEKSKEDLNALNVFPVPDGDTGTNMSLTMMTAVKEVKGADASKVSNIADALSLGALKGARGNSGVILSQIFRGFAKGLEGLGEAKAADFAKAMQEGVNAAYKAVMKPKEGTILTVAKDMAKAGARSAGAGADIDGLMNSALEQGADTLRRTPDMLPVLKEAGVVDAGGKGLLIIYRGFKMALDGDVVTEDLDFDTEMSENPNFDFADFNQDIEFAYCTEFFINHINDDVKQEDVDKYRDKLAGIGDCVLVVGDLQLIKTHVHTNTPGKALEYALKFGQLSKIKIENMREQHTELVQEAEQVEKKEMAVVTVASGDGIVNIFREFLVDEIVTGGQTMNPSAELITEAIEKAPSDNVFVFPNNKNIILAAEQAAELSKKNVQVIHSKSFPQGITGVLAYNPELDFDENKSRMEKAIDTVKTGQVTSAVRASSVSGKKIKKGEIIGIQDGEITCHHEDIESTCMELIEGMVGEDDSIITIFFGEDTTEDDAQALADKLEEKYDDFDIELQYGGQPVYNYIFAVE